MVNIMVDLVHCLRQGGGDVGAAPWDIRWDIRWDIMVDIMGGYHGAGEDSREASFLA